MESLSYQLKEQIIDALNLKGMTPSDIDGDAPLFGEQGLGLDSIDALELIVILEKNYAIKLTDPAKSKDILKSVNSMVSYIEANGKF